MDNKVIAKAFKLSSQLMELHNENPFRTKAMASASFKIDKLPFPAATASFEELSEQPGIGKGTAERIQAFVQTGTFPELQQLIDKTPAGVRDMLSIKGLGPKKVQVIWQDLEIESVGELLYAVNENRLIEAKGFGLKTQEDIKKSIEFANANQGLFLYAKVARQAAAFLSILTTNFPSEQHAITGDFRRKAEIIAQLEFLTTSSLIDLADQLQQLEEYTVVPSEEGFLLYTDPVGLHYKIIATTHASFALDFLKTTGSEAHIQQLLSLASPLPALENEAAIYSALGLDYIEPELREGGAEIKWAKEGKLPTLITFEDLKGTVHNHSTYSDGVHTLAQMASYCKEELKLEYLGICDHSRTAVYANGLSIERLAEQWKEIDQLNQSLAPFRIFKGIESDILSDGSLDYPEEILRQFDFVVASVHSNLKMDEEKATERLLKAIENPYTTILGHPTGRLLLSRSGYPLDFKKIIDACAANKVVIEINANPLRLDLDWRWHQYALEKGVILSINPDAHRTEGLLDMNYGINVARKGGLTADKCLNAFTLDQIETYFKTRKGTI
ncbi:DNA polymerase/3'-5' exonuclease PolX [Sphingobacterium psychroaquaticum]|uniref:DNA polymerase/3'-5' exonuclease PolX n=1 Tax=Sphingobacterium psychroaquaticum TaxID=561061 RepID=UPI00106A5DCB|nr:DNA polymerase/3'-5' exonuclease PolX [Sphingobacterium psychroaquaticum]QBQ42152.1 DNA polymerase/3'-5' exonuclease PolX [Sphingobacterium psychroaquaticum]